MCFDARRAGLVRERAGAVHVDRLGELRVARAGRVADDRREVDDRAGALERRAACRLVADVSAPELRAELLEPRSDVVLVVQEHVERAHRAALLAQLLDERRPYVARSTRHQHQITHVSLLGVQRHQELG